MSKRMPEYRRQLVKELRQNQTPTEDLLWHYLRAGRMLGLKFRRQRPLNRYVADFCCDLIQFVVEIDGEIHEMEENIEYDAVRNEFLAAHGYHVMHISRLDVMNQIEHVIAQITEKAQALLANTPGTPPKS